MHLDQLMIYDTCCLTCYDCQNINITQLTTCDYQRLLTYRIINFRNIPIISNSNYDN